jgi:hypothetical protein
MCEQYANHVVVGSADRNSERGSIIHITRVDDRGGEIQKQALHHLYFVMICGEVEGAPAQLAPHQLPPVPLDEGPKARKNMSCGYVGGVEKPGVME